MNVKMKNNEYFLLFIFIVILIILLLFFISNPCLVYTQNSTAKAQFITNQEYIEALRNTELDADNEDEVFRFVFANLDDEIIVYPTENYFYFKFIAQGKTFGSALTFPPHMRENNSIGLGYIERTDVPQDEPSPPLTGGWKVFTEKDGLEMEKIDDFTYNITFEKKSVIFKLNNPGLNPPKKAKLTKDEIYIGPIVDESGLEFHILFNGEISKLYFILNEENLIPTTFEEIGTGILRDRRTRFVFFDDKANYRKILIGVNAAHINNNDWFDGPFDQLPDNYVYLNQINMGKYLEMHFNFTENTIDKYGYYARSDGSRVALSPYILYFSEYNFGFVNSCKNATKSNSEFYGCITNTLFLPSNYTY